MLLPSLQMLRSYWSAAAPRAYTPSRALRAYGFRRCPWMSLEKDVRYPRRLDPRGHRPKESLVSCLERLVEWQERGDILFILKEGMGLGAQMSGGYHGNWDDDDIDMTVFSRRPDTTRMKHYEWCSDKGIDLGSFGFHIVDAPNMSSYVLSAQRERFSGENLCCIGRWESFDVLLPHPNAHYFRELHGGSYWVPPVAGGKEMGKKFEEYMNPDTALFKWFTWLKTFHDGLRTLDQDGDEAISVQEFFTFLESSNRVNQNWLTRARKKQPCFVANALVHYENLMKFAGLMRSLRRRCEADYVPSKTSCHAENWRFFKAEYGDGPVYFADEGFDGDKSPDAEACRKRIAVADM